MEEDAMDLIFGNREESAAKWRILVVEDKCRLAIEFVQFGHQV
jgi:hypothetical protein